MFYTAPTAIRALMREGEAPVKKATRASLRVLGSVGEPINPEAWEWYYRVVGDGRCPIVDTWWQTETGGILITPLPGAIDAEAGLGDPAVLRRQTRHRRRQRQYARRRHAKAISSCSIPGPARCAPCTAITSVSSTPISKPIRAMYFTGDGARRDDDGYYWITGRVDDVINVSGHRLGTAEVESALVAHPTVAEAAVVGFPHDIKGQGIYAYVTLKTGVDSSEDLRQELIAHVRKEIGPIATPDHLHWAPACRRRARARSCAASCARSPRMRRTSSATFPRLPIRPWSSTWWIRGW